MDNFKTHTILEVQHIYMGICYCSFIYLCMHKVSNISGVVDDVDFTSRGMCVVVNGEVFSTAASTATAVKAAGD